MAAPWRSTRLRTVTRSPSAPLVIPHTPFPSPTVSVGSPIVKHMPNQDPLLAVARKGPTYRDDAIAPVGFFNSRVQCYMNASIAVLINLTPFLGFLDQIYETDYEKSGPQGAADRDILARLKSIAEVYWAKPTRQRQNDIDSVANKFKTWFLRVIGTISKDPLFRGTNPFLPATERPAEEDASDSMDKILEIADYNLGMRPQEREALAALTVPVLTLRVACGNTGKGCQTNAKMRASRGFLTSHQRLLTIDVPPYAPKAKSLEDCIEHFMNKRQNQVDCALCNAALANDVRKDPKRVIPPGREWHRIREAPEILFIKLDRLKQTDPLKPYSITKSEERIVINETLDLSQYLEQDDKDANASARYRLDGVISRAGSGISSGHYIAHVRHHVEPARWFSLNDNIVREEKFADAIAHEGKFSGQDFTPYVLAYTKIHDEVEAANEKSISGESQKTDEIETELPELDEILKTPPATKVTKKDATSEKPTATKPGSIKSTVGSKRTSQTANTGKNSVIRIPSPVTPPATRTAAAMHPDRSFSPHELATLTTTIFANNTRIRADPRDVMLDLEASSEPALSAQFSLALADGTTYAFVPKCGNNGIEMPERVDLALASAKKPVTPTPKTQQMPLTPESNVKVGGKGIRSSAQVVAKDTEYYPRPGPVRISRRSKSSRVESDSIAVRTAARKVKPATGKSKSKSKTPESVPRTTMGKTGGKRKTEDVVDLTGDEGAKNGGRKGDVVDLTNNDDAANGGAKKGRKLKKRRVG